MAHLRYVAQNLTPRQREVLAWLNDHEDDGEGELVQQGRVAHLGSGYNPVAPRTVFALLRAMAIRDMPGMPHADDYHVYVITGIGQAMLRGEIPPDSEWR